MTDKPESQILNLYSVTVLTFMEDIRVPDNRVLNSKKSQLYNNVHGGLIEWRLTESGDLQSKRQSPE